MTPKCRIEIFVNIYRSKFYQNISKSKIAPFLKNCRHCELMTPKCRIEIFNFFFSVICFWCSAGFRGKFTSSAFFRPTRLITRNYCRFSPLLAALLCRFRRSWSARLREAPIGAKLTFSKLENSIRKNAAKPTKFCRLFWPLWRLQWFRQEF